MLCCAPLLLVRINCSSACLTSCILDDLQSSIMLSCMVMHVSTQDREEICQHITSLCRRGLQRRPVLSAMCPQMAAE